MRQRVVTDSRKQREIVVVLVTTGVAAIIAQLYVGPAVAKRLNVRRPK